MLGISLSSGWGCTLLTILVPRHALHGEHGAVEASIRIVEQAPHAEPSPSPYYPER